MKAILVCGGEIEDSFALSVFDRIRPDYIIGLTEDWNSVISTILFPTIFWGISTAFLQRSCPIMKIRIRR